MTEIRSSRDVRGQRSKIYSKKRVFHGDDDLSKSEVTTVSKTSVFFDDQKTKWLLWHVVSVILFRHSSSSRQSKWQSNGMINFIQHNADLGMYLFMRSVVGVEIETIS